MVMQEPQFHKESASVPEALRSSKSLAVNMHHADVTPLHILASLLDMGDPLLLSLCESLRLDRRALDLRIRMHMIRVPRVATENIGEARPGTDFTKLLRSCGQLQQRWNDSKLSVTHLLWASLESSDVKNVIEEVSSEPISSVQNALAKILRPPSRSDPQVPTQAAGGFLSADDNEARPLTEDFLVSGSTISALNIILTRCFFVSE